MRNKHGNMLVLVIAFVFIILMLLFFGLSYTRMIGSSSEQKTAIEAAALAAARDMSAIVVDTPEFGFVGLSDSAPTGSATSASDNYYTSVVSINTLIGTSRLDLLIADEMIKNNIDVPEWKELAKQDLQNARNAGATLIQALQNAITPTGTGTDKNGNTLTPYLSAESAYTQNQIRLTGGSSYVTGSMKLSLGAIPSVGTNIPVPKPLGVDPSINSTNSVDNCYRAYINVPFDGEDYYFAAIGSAVKLVDSRNWVATIGSIPPDSYFPTIVKAEAVQKVDDSSTGSNNLKGVACAMPASVYDPKPAPGYFTLSFPDGMPDKEKGDPDKDGFGVAVPWNKKSPLAPRHLYSKEMQGGDDDSDYYYASNGDYPTDTSSTIEDDSSWPLNAFDNQKKIGTCCKLAIYDWVRRAGTKADVDAVIGMHTTPLLPQGPDVLWPPPIIQADQELIPAGIVHIYRFEPDGAIYYEARDLKPLPFSVVSDDQILVECHDALKDSANHEPEIKNIDIGPPIGPPGLKKGVVKFKKMYDVYIRIYSRKPGNNQGGQHSGEPLDDNVVHRLTQPLQKPLHAPVTVALSDFARSRGECRPVFLEGRGAKAKRAKGVAANVDKGALPTLGPREDFMFVYTPGNPGNWDVQRNKAFYRTYSNGTGFRPSYQANGIAVDIRFRRPFEAKEGLLQLMGSWGYVIDK